jgi:hypothetical protein
VSNRVSEKDVTQEYGVCQSHSFDPQIHAQTKQSKQKHCCNEETNLQCSTSQDDFAIHLPAHTAEHLGENVDPQFVLVR